MSNFQENDQTTINASTNNIFVQGMPTTTQLAIQQKQDHIQTMNEKMKCVRESLTKLHSEYTSQEIRAQIC